MENKPGGKPKIQITEIFLAKAGNDFSRCFHGIIKREKDEHGTPFVFGKILVKNRKHNGYIYSRASDQWILGEKLDEMVLLILDNGLNDDKGKSSKIAETDFFHN